MAHQWDDPDAMMSGILEAPHFDDPEIVTVVGTERDPRAKPDIKPDYRIRSNLISDEYLAVQREMHKDASYGLSGHRYAKVVADTLEDLKAHSVLDYGSGKGTLKRELSSLGWDDVHEYDPAIPGKDRPPMPADIVACTDVLEHVEPDKLDAVLEHIRALALKAVVLVVRTSPAKKSLPDGTNAHINLHGTDWWRHKLGVFFDVQQFNMQEKEGISGVGVLAFPYRLIGDIVPVAVLDEEVRFEAIKQNVKLTDRRLMIVPPHDRVAILACYGPSLKDTWPAIVEEHNLLNQYEGGDIVTVSGAHDFLISEGIVPKYHIECDPREHKAQMSEALRDDVTYLYASVCHPNVVGRLKGKDNLVLWHVEGGEIGKRIRRELEPNALLVGGGSTVGLRAIGVLATLGYRRFIIHGMDCSYREESHAGIHTGKKQKRIDVVCYGRPFVSSPALLSNVREFDELRQNFIGQPPNKIEIVLRGDGLLQHALRNTPGATAMQVEEVA